MFYLQDRPLGIMIMDKNINLPVNINLNLT